MTTLDFLLEDGIGWSQAMQEWEKVAGTRGAHSSGWFGFITKPEPESRWFGSKIFEPKSEPIFFGTEPMVLG